MYILQFTASWCSVCRKEMPHLEERVWQRIQRTAAFTLLLGVDLDEPADPRSKALVDGTGVTYPDVPGPRRSPVFEAVTVPKAGVTRNVVVDREGRIAFLTRLFDEAEFEAMVSASSKPWSKHDHNERGIQPREKTGGGSARTPQKQWAEAEHAVCRPHGRE